MTNTAIAPTNDEMIADQTPTPSPAKGFAVTAMVLGIIAVVLGMTFLLGQFGAFLGAIAAVFGFIAFRKNKKAGHKKGMATAGLVLGLIAVPLGIATSAALISAVDEAVDSFDTSMVVLEAEWHLEGEYTDYVNDVDATATSGDVIDGVTTIKVTETGTTNVIAEHQVQINDDGTFVILD